jgi:hypothetical protein
MSNSEDTKYSRSLIRLIYDCKIDDMIRMGRLIIKHNHFIASVHCEPNIIIVHISIIKETKNI